jgi:hypothetical protein
MPVTGHRHERVTTLPAIPVTDPVQHADPGRGQQRDRGHRDVLVNARSERREREIPPEHLVPHGHRQVDQRRRLGQRSQLAAGQARTARAGRPIRVQVLVIEDQHIRPQPVQRVRDGGERAGGEFVVAVDKPHILPRCLRRAEFPRAPGPHRRLSTDRRHAARGENLAAPVRGRVVDSDHLDPVVVLAQNGLQATRQVLLDAMDWDDYADLWHRWERYSPREYALSEPAGEYMRAGY